MTNLMKYNAANLNQFLDLINRNSIGMNDYFDRLTTIPETQSNYPPYNLVQVSGQEFRLELALAGFKRTKSMSTPKRANSLSRVTKKSKKQKKTISTEEWLHDLSPELGPSQMKRKLDQLYLRMGF